MRQSPSPVTPQYVRRKRDFNSSTRDGTRGPVMVLDPAETLHEPISADRCNALGICI